MFALRVDARIDAVEDAADQDRPPDDLGAEFPGERLDVVEAEIGPGAGAVEEEFDHGVSLCFLSLRWVFKSSLRAKRSNPYSFCGHMDCFASLAMTGLRLTSSPPSPSPSRRTCSCAPPRQKAPS